MNVFRYISTGVLLFLIALKLGGWFYLVFAAYIILIAAWWTGTMNPELMMMLRALFPDMVDLQFVPAEWNTVAIPHFFGEYAPETEQAFEIERVELQPITEASDVWAGMSEKTRTVFVCIR